MCRSQRLRLARGGSENRSRSLTAVRPGTHGDRSDRTGTYRYFLNIVDVGFGAHTVANFSSVPKFLTGNPAYLAAVLKTMISYPVLKMRIELDGAPVFEQFTTMTAIGNGRCFGGGFWVCPEALPDDGMLDVMVADGSAVPIFFDCCRG